MKTFYTLLLLLFCLNIYSQDACKKYKRFVSDKIDEFTNTTSYYSANSPVYILEDKDGNVTLIWKIVLDEKVDTKHDLISVLCDGNRVDIELDESTVEYSQVTRRDYDTAFSIGSPVVSFIGSNEAFFRTEIKIKDDRCLEIMELIINSKKNKIRLWKGSTNDFSFSSVRKREINNVLSLYKCLISN